MQVKYHGHPDAVRHYDAAQLRRDFVADDLMQPWQIVLHYTVFDRFIYGSAVPTSKPLPLGTYDALKSDSFLERRELGILNVGGTGNIEAGGKSYAMQKGDVLYLGKGVENVIFHSDKDSNPAQYYLNSAPAHKAYPTVKASRDEANIVELGDQDHANKRKIFQYIHEGGIQSCQLVMGYTELAPGNIWNTFPPHTHDRRMEVYFYFDLPTDQVVMHFMGEPSETRHVVLRNHNAVVSPPWSIHAGAGTCAYRFAWGMAGENKAFTDMDMVSFDQLR